MGYNLNYNYNDLTTTEPWNRGLFEGNHAKMAELFRLVNCYHLPRSMIWINVGRRWKTTMFNLIS
jgi:hypothetical protein